MLMKPLHARGYHVLRYNSRGVGSSTGWASFTGLSEAGDLAALTEWAVDKLGDVRSVVVLVIDYSGCGLRRADLAVTGLLLRLSHRVPAARSTKYPDLAHLALVPAGRSRMVDVFQVAICGGVERAPAQPRV